MAFIQSDSFVPLSQEEFHSECVDKLMKLITSYVDCLDSLHLSPAVASTYYMQLAEVFRKAAKQLSEQIQTLLWTPQESSAAVFEEVAVEDPNAAPKRKHMLPLTQRDCVAICDLEKAFLEFKILHDHLQTKLKPEAGAALPEVEKLALDCAESTISSSFQEAQSVLWDTVIQHLERIVNEIADLLQETIEGLLRQPEKLFDLLSLPVLSRELDLLYANMPPQLFKDYILTNVWKRAVELLQSTALRPGSFKLDKALSSHQIASIRTAYEEFIKFFHRQEKGLQLSLMRETSGKLLRILDLAEKDTLHLMDLHASLTAPPPPTPTFLNPIEKDTPSPPEEADPQDVYFLIDARKNTEPKAREWVERVDRLAAEEKLKRENRDALMKQLRPYFELAETEQLVEEYGCAGGWIYLTSNYLLFYPLIVGTTEKLKLPLSDFKAVDKFTSWFVEGMKIVMRNGDIHLFKGPLRNAPITDIPVRARAMGFTTPAFISYSPGKFLGN